VIRSRSGSLAVAVRGKLSGLVTYVRMTRPLKPDEGGTNGRLTGIHSGELVRLAETCGEVCGAAQTATHAAESGMRWVAMN
jgi:hypothetical protein